VSSLFDHDLRLRLFRSFATIRAMSRHPTSKAGKMMLGRYRIERELGRGGMGVVYVATDVNTDRQVAIKTTSVAGLGSGEKARNQRRERFVREVRALTQVNHENVVHVFDAGEVDDPDLGWLLFYTMEYVEGTTLANLVADKGPLQEGEAAAVVAQVALGLGAAHRQGIVHRDVKPANIFLSNDGRALIGDFGIAKIEGSTQITRRDQLVGTPNYLAPEQILGEAVGPYTDVFALGALLYVITQNRPLRQQVDAGSLLASANNNDLVQRMLAAQGLSARLKQAVARCLERDPSRRYSDGTAFADALAEHATRVPRLSNDTSRAFLNEGTLDRSDAFAPAAVDDAEVNASTGLSTFGADPSSIEAMAQAMLGEVERRSGVTTRPERNALAPSSPPAPPPVGLPIPPSTRPRIPSSSSLPAASAGEVPAVKARTGEVSRPESTYVVKRAPTNEVVSEQARDAALNGPTVVRSRPATSASTELTAPTMTGSSPSTLSRAMATGSPTSATLPLVSRRTRRVQQIAGAFVGGAVLGLVAAFATAPPDLLASSSGTTATTSSSSATSKDKPRPALCPATTVNQQNQARASLALDEARTLRQKGAKQSAVVDKLREGIALDPTNHLLLYELGRVSGPGQQMDDADACVCAVAPSSSECRKVEKARGL
jgi:serine/threonine protein kinase